MFKSELFCAKIKLVNREKIEKVDEKVDKLKSKKRDGKWREIKIEVKSTSELISKTKPGYFAK